MRAALALVCLLFAADAAAESPVRIWKGKKSATTEGVVVLATSPAEVYRVVTDYAQWKTLFFDVTSVRVKSGGRRDATVEFESKALGHEVTVRFDNTEGRVIHFQLVEGPPGARAWGEYVLEPSDGGRKTTVRATLYMDVVGAMAWVVTDDSIRKKRERKLRSDLEDLAHRFNRVPGT
jgi:hypothetical protein